MKTLVQPTLYKKTNTGAIQQWQVSCLEGTIKTVYGQVGGKLQVTTDTLKVGKNQGKTNETTLNEQTEKEVIARWTKQKKKGYVEDYKDACNDKVDEEMVQGGVPPMLSINKSHPKDPILSQYLKFPCIVQPKLDGACCIAMVTKGKATLWSRTQKPIKCVPHIVDELERLFPTGTVILHGELYNHAYHDSFEDLMSIVRKNEPDEEGEHKKIKLFVYDCPLYNDTIGYGTPYLERNHMYQKLLNLVGIVRERNIFPLQSCYCSSMKEVLDNYERFLESGYEGAMAKNIQAPYESGKRSRNILKMKEFVDGEFEIVGVEDGRGKDKDIASTFVCKMGNGNTFSARMKCTWEQKRKYWLQRDDLIGKLITVTYKRFTNKGYPYLPVAKAIRDYE